MMMQLGDVDEVRCPLDDDGEGSINSGRSGQTAADEMMILVGFKRTLHTAHQMRPSKKHSHRYPHHHKHRDPWCRPAHRPYPVTRVLWCSLVLFLVICDSQTALVWRALVGGGGSAEAASILPPVETVATVGPGAVGLLNGRDGDSITEEEEAAASGGGASVNHTKLLELVMEGLGLTTIPDVRLLNISQREYETKYAEYLDRVNRRQAMAALDGESATGTWYEQRRLFSFPGSDHTLNHRKLRRKRSLNNDYDLVYIRFDIPTRNASTGEMSGFQSPSLFHDPTSGTATTTGRPAAASSSSSSSGELDPEDEMEAGGLLPNSIRADISNSHHRQSLSELPPISPENIEESSLNIMLIRRQNSARSINSHGKQQQNQQQQHQHHTTQQQHHHPHRTRQPQTPAQHHQHHLAQQQQQSSHSQSRRKNRAKHKQQQQQKQHQQQQQHHGSRTVTIHVYQLVDPYERHFLTSKTIPVEDIAPNGSHWYQLPLEEAVRTWLDGSRKNLGLELYCEGCHANDLYIVHDSSPFFRSYEETPVLNVVGRLVQREKRSKVQRYRPMLHDYQSPPKTTACRTDNKRCCRHPLLVDFRDIQGYEFIIQPKIFDAGFCRGRCPTKYNPATHHALLQSLLHEHIKYDVPKPCCAPTRLDHIDILHPDPKNPQRLKVSTWHSMRVLECACS
ncbi:uncharacterized protein LOC126574857 [Anopheles aquasalis]|uniref:uncharacterized protein LOC126574857 n=1 Tax=Anopheles aquasalis TaxID=42839 RepID=UPI00215A9DCE|nr:uncharacterized protein LOC126574857 [Anopheles aquasalis]XP_050091211.1 uncharacterized protein LOC126574857 [Anopheles aquasalis]